MNIPETPDVGVSHHKRTIRNRINIFRGLNEKTKKLFKILKRTKRTNKKEQEYQSDCKVENLIYEPDSIFQFGGETFSRILATVTSTFSEKPLKIQLIASRDLHHSLQKTSTTLAEEFLSQPDYYIESYLATSLALSPSRVVADNFDVYNELIEKSYLEGTYLTVVENHGFDDAKHGIPWEASANKGFSALGTVQEMVDTFVSQSQNLPPDQRINTLLLSVCNPGNQDVTSSVADIYYGHGNINKTFGRPPIIPFKWEHVLQKRISLPLGKYFY